MPEAADARHEVSDEENSLRILVATDNHIGYMENDVIRGNDSMNSFEEVLQIAKKHDVDFLLLGGDLYHENKPSRKVLHDSMTLFRKYCMGDKPVQYEFLSDQSVNFGHTQFPNVNYEDSNLNVSLPVFSIHGNHDDPTGSGNLCSLDLLSAAGFVNYFGKSSSLEKIEISPLLIQKGTTKLALYGLGSVRDERLHRMFSKKEVSMLRPAENKGDWFNIFVIHQNRAKHGQTNYIPEQFLADFLDLVIWGHEHECKLSPVWNAVQQFYVSQPGSSVATSLSQGETIEKHVGLLTIKNKEFKIKPIPLQTVRQFYMKDIVLSETTLDPNDVVNLVSREEAYCAQKVQQMIDTAETKRNGNPRQPQLPLIRLRIDYSGGFEMFNIRRFGQRFVDKVANPKDIVLFQRKKAVRAATEQGAANGVDFTGRADSLDTARVEDMVKQYFSHTDERNQMQLLTERGLGEAVKEFVDKDEKGAISALVTHQLDKTQTRLKQRNVAEDAIDVEIGRYKDERNSQTAEEELAEVTEVIARTRHTHPSTHDEEEDGDDGSDRDAPRTTRRRADGDAPSTSARGRGGRGGRGSRGGRGRGGRGRGTASDGNRSIADAFKTSPKSSKYTGGACNYADDSGGDVEILDDDPDSSRSRREQTTRNDDPDSTRSRRRKTPVVKQSPKATPKRQRKGARFSSSEEEDFTAPAKRRQ